MRMERFPGFSRSASVLMRNCSIPLPLSTSSPCESFFLLIPVLIFLLNFSTSDLPSDLPSSSSSSSRCKFFLLFPLEDAWFFCSRPRVFLLLQSQTSSCVYPLSPLLFAVSICTCGASFPHGEFTLEFLSSYEDGTGSFSPLV